MINLAHACVKATNNARRLRRLGQRFKSTHRSHPQVATKGNALCHATSYAQTGKRTRTGTERDAVKITAGHTLRRQQRVNHRQQRLGIARACAGIKRVEAAVAPQRHGT